MPAKARKRSRKFWTKRRTAPGAAPGTIAVDPAAPHPIITVIAFSTDDMVEKQVDGPEALQEFISRWPVTWVNVDGLGDAEVIRRIGHIFGLHQLALEDVVNVHQRAKVEEYGDHLFIVARMVEFAERLETEQVSMFLGSKYVVTFQERPGRDSIEPVRERLRKSRNKIRAGSGADYLIYSLIDAVLDGYFPVLEQYGERLENLEEEVTTSNNLQTISRIHEIKSDLLVIRRAIWPHREAINTLVRDVNPLISQETRVYLRDCYDHSIQLIDLLETYRELGGDLRDLYLSSASNRMNEIMKVLTVISTIFIPLNFVAGIYGMNFNPDRSPYNMPELNWYFGYPYALTLMATVGAGMLVYIWRKGWMQSATTPYRPSALRNDGHSTGDAKDAGGRTTE